MIAIKPTTEEKTKLIFERLSLIFTAGSGAVAAYNADEYLGAAAFELRDGAFKLLALEPWDDKWLSDSLARAAFHFALNRGIIVAELGEKISGEAFFELGYIENIEKKEVNIIELFTKCKNCGNID